MVKKKIKENEREFAFNLNLALTITADFDEAEYTDHKNKVRQEENKWIEENTRREMEERRQMKWLNGFLYGIIGIGTALAVLYEFGCGYSNKKSIESTLNRNTNSSSALYLQSPLKP
jgi:hypothetical protein